MLTRKHQLLSEEDYLQMELDSPVRHEYVAGEVFAMTGATLRHNIIALNIATALRAHLRATPCRVFMADVRVRVEKANAHYYPDVLVSCGPSVQKIDLQTYAVEDPILVVEVLSNYTEATDRREKLLAYRTLTSLKEYVLVSQNEARVEIHRRASESCWEYIEYSGLETVEFASVDLKLDMREIYEGVPLDALTLDPTRT
ncbi:Uma2 family endonuclease [Methylocaldum szegediense]|uniref:Uma2 family endonuclease n=1 Tax=Methylocaldum szegediense TaxID=73780 RepID=A0ABN8XA90_9GAMM|nr:Uma2 family endonuclease [Methylocaldum szegediense]CAI8972242.1 Uma2 family endonuclease [Methylocaldum szegediense]